MNQNTQQPDHPTAHSTPETGALPVAKPLNPDGEDEQRLSAIQRAWLAIPNWVFALIGIAIFLALFGDSIDHMRRVGFAKSGWWHKTKDGETIRLAWAYLLVLCTYVLIILAFVFRRPPKSRACRASEIIIPLIAAVWPLLPWIALRILDATGHKQAAAFQNFIIDKRITLNWFLAGGACVCIGNALDVWGYSYLFRSFSIVAEARELVVTGPYRIVRHPVYLGQIIAQAGIWICFAPFHIVWLCFFVFFAAMQLYRGQVEDEVLERAFGERYRRWREKTYWFI